MIYSPETFTPDVLLDVLPALQAELGLHPFATPLLRSDLERLLPEFFAMSQAFPYLQAAAPKEMIFDAIAKNTDVPVDVELTAAVGSFICWDEAGGYDVLLRHGKAGLAKALETRRRFHCNLLRNDLAVIFGRAVRPNYGPDTRRYLRHLYAGLASQNAVRRCAYMVAFEMHAEKMIGALWASVVAATGLAREQLLYFEAHVGGDDPAEGYHAQMTQRLVQELVPPSARERFLAEFREAYRKSLAWCRAIAAEQPVEPRDDGDPARSENSCRS